MEFDRGKRIRTHLDIAPLIDIVFLLLVFFMLTSNFLMSRGIQITLPSSSTSEDQEPKMCRVFITDENEIFLNDTETDLDGLSEKLRIRLEEERESIVILESDEKVNLGFVITVMDAIREAGAIDVVIATDMKKNKNASLCKEQ